MDALEEEKAALFHRWEFPWHVIQVLTGKSSTIDLKKLPVDDWKDADAFTLAYGFDVHSSKDQRLVHAIFIEAIFFIQKYLMPTEWKQGIRPPQEILLCVDVQQLLLWASKRGRDPGSRLCQAWSCAILRVMHTIVHIDGLQRLTLMQAAHDKLRARFEPYLWKDADNRLYLGSSQEFLEIEGFRWKTAKSRESIILKLLHKPANVAETIYDLTGLRIITTRVSDAMIVLKFLRKFNLVSFASVNPARVRNNLLDVEHFQVHCEALREQLARGEVSPSEFREKIDQIERVEAKNNLHNPYSSSTYRSLQLTGRLRVERVDPLSRFFDRLDTLLPICEASRKPVLEGLLQYGRMHLANREREQSAFFPYEIQIMDKESAKEILEGEASHFRYKRAQFKAARRRTLGELFLLVKNQSQ